MLSIVVGLLLLGLALLLYPLVNPSIEAAGSSPPVDTRVCALAGSMNPPHLGHMALLQHLHRRGHRRIFVAIGFNPSKANAVAPERRAELLRTMCSAAGLSDWVEVHVVNGYIWRWASGLGVRTLFRGIRSWCKDGPEERMLHLRNQIGPVLLGLRVPIPTVFLAADPEFAHISSTLVRRRCEECASEELAEEALEGLVPAGLAVDVWRLYSSRASTARVAATAPARPAGWTPPATAT